MAGRKMKTRHGLIAILLLHVFIPANAEREILFLASCPLRTRARRMRAYPGGSGYFARCRSYPSATNCSYACHTSFGISCSI
jgi:hypothetical protein